MNEVLRLFRAADIAPGRNPDRAANGDYINSERPPQSSWCCDGAGKIGAVKPFRDTAGESLLHI